MMVINEIHEIKRLGGVNLIDSLELYIYSSE